MHTADQIVKSIKRRQRLGFLLMVIAVFVMIVFLPFELYIKAPVAFLLGFSIWVAFLMRAAVRVQRLLTVEMQPITWHYVAYKTGQASAQNMAVDADAAYLTGSYQTATNICLTQLARKETKPLLRCGFCCVLAQIYFQTEEFEALRAFLPTWEAAMQHPKAKKRAEKVYGNLLRYAQSFLQGDLEACKQLRLKEDALPSKAKTPFSSYGALFLDAVARERLGELEVARAGFEAVRMHCPGLYIAKLSADHLAAMERGEAYRFQPAPEHVMPPSFPLAPAQGYKERKHPKLTLALSLVVLVGVVLFVYVGEALSPKYDPYEAVLEYEEIVELYHTVPLNDAGDALCLYMADDSWFYGEDPSEENYYLRAAFLECNGEDDYVLIDYMDIEPRKTYYMDMGAQDVYVEFCVVPPKDPMTKQSEESYSFTTYQNVAYVLCILEVKESESFRFFSDYGEK